MGHRHTFNMPHILETDRNQRWNHAEQPYLPMARAGPSLVHPVENMSIQGGPLPSPWIPPPWSRGYSSSIVNAELPHYQPRAPDQSRDPYTHHPAPGNFHMIPDNYSYPSSRLSGQTIPGVDGGFYSRTMGSGRGPYKRKSPGIPQPWDRGSTSSYYDVGSSSNQQDIASYHRRWEHPAGYRVNSVSISGEDMQRNVRSRTGVDLETNLARSHLTGNSLHHSFSSQSSDQPNSVGSWGQNSNVPTREWNHSLMPPAGQEAIYGTDPSFYSHDPNTLNTHNSYAYGSVESGGYHSNATSNRNYVPQNANSNLDQSIRDIRSGYGQRSVPSFRAFSSNFGSGQVAGSDENPQIAAESYPPSRYPPTFSTVSLRNTERTDGTGISSGGYRSFTWDASLLDQLSPEEFPDADHSTLYGSRMLFDEHTDMRLDIDNMSYEELLVLGERIGSVSTGLSDALILKCLSVSVHGSSDQSQHDVKCVICLEEYQSMDVVGTLKCGHDFHEGCIRKWLSIKNACPICKAPAMDDNTKDN